MRVTDSPVYPYGGLVDMDGDMDGDMNAVMSGSIGSRVAALRELVGMPQEKLAAAADVSVDLVRAVEQGLTPASAAFTAGAAVALGLDVTALTGQPYDELVLDPRSAAGGLAVLREVLYDEDYAGSITPLLTLDMLRARLDVLIQARFQARYAEIVRNLPELLRELYAQQAVAQHGGWEREQLAVMLDDAYSLAQTACYRLGYLDLTALLDDRRTLAVIHTMDPLRHAADTFARTHLLLNRGDYDGCVRRIDGALRVLAEVRGEAARAVCGQLHLRLALVAARDARAQDADDHLAEARDIVASGVPAHPYPDIDCSQLNVDIHYVSVPVELDDGTTAVARAESVHRDVHWGGHRGDHGGELDQGRSRIGRHYIDLARAWVLHGDRAQALDALNTARELAPELVRYHPSVRETIHALANAERRDEESLASFVRWTGLTNSES